jgi:hypothetical protein
MGRSTTAPTSTAPSTTRPPESAPTETSKFDRFYSFRRTAQLIAIRVTCQLGGSNSWTFLKLSFSNNYVEFKISSSCRKKASVVQLIKLPYCCC